MLFIDVSHAWKIAAVRSRHATIPLTCTKASFHLLNLARNIVRTRQRNSPADSLIALLIVRRQSKRTPIILKSSSCGQWCETTWMDSFFGSDSTWFALPHVCNYSWHLCASAANIMFGVSKSKSRNAFRSSADTTSRRSCLCKAAVASS